MGDEMNNLRMPDGATPGHYVQGADTNHFFGRCDECDAHYMSAMSAATIDRHYRQGLIGQDAFEAYMHVWATSAFRYGSSGVGWEKPPTEFPRAMAIVAVLREAVDVRRGVRPVTALRDAA